MEQYVLVAALGIAQGIGELEIMQDRQNQYYLRMRKIFKKL
jgi:hypothetical protein